MILDDFSGVPSPTGIVLGRVKAPSLAPICSLELEPISFFIFCQGLGNIRHCLDPCFFLEVLHPLEVNHYIHVQSQCVYIYVCVSVI